MPKRRGRERERESQSRGGGGDEKRPRRRRYLYLALDDRAKAFSIYRVGAGDLELAARVEAPVPDAAMLFAGLGGGRILAVTDQHRGRAPAVVYDAAAGVGLVPGPRAPRVGFDVVVAAGDALYAFSTPCFNDERSLQVLSWAAPAPGPGASCLLSWTVLPGPPPPHDPDEVITSYAARPDGGAVFLTTSCRDRPGVRLRTYEFHTARRAWRWHAWALPFDGQGHFDAGLGAWVGLRRDGRVCACRVATGTGSAAPVGLGLAQLEWQVAAGEREGEEKLFRRDPERHVRASLARTGSGEFCVVESVRRRDCDDGYDHLGERHGCVLRVTMFGLEYDRKGELRLRPSREHQPATHSFLVAKHKGFSFAPEAFWM